jgi:DNA adenine methylase
MAPWIIEHFPEHYSYVEPFGGGASVLLRKPASQLEVYNDIDGDVVNFFRVLREKPDELVKVIELTPFAREEYEISWERTDDEVERARRLYIKTKQGYGSHTNKKSGWRWEKTKKSGRTAIGGWNKPLNHLLEHARRLRECQIDNDNYLVVIDRYDTPDTLFYLDPPYVESTLKSKHAYQFSLTDEQHEELLTKIKKISGMVIISMLNHPMYNEMLSEWKKNTKERYTQNGNKYFECIWISPNAQKNSKQMRMEL